MKFSSAALSAAALLSPSFLVVAQDAPWLENCRQATQLTCGDTITGDLSDPNDPLNIFVPTSDLDVSCPGFNNFISGDSVGQWFKISIGQDQIFLVTFDTCTSSFDTVLGLYQGSECGTTADATMSCVDWDDDSTACGLQAIIADTNPNGDSDYWIFLDGFGGSTGTYALTVTCTDVPTIDPWFIQRSAFPPPRVTSVDPLTGGTYLEINNDRVPELPTVLEATFHELPLLPGDKCDTGTPLSPSFPFTLTNTPCPAGDPGCPMAMSGGTPVLQEFILGDPSNNPFDTPFWVPGAGNYDGQFQFCVSTKLMLDYEGGPALDEVSYFDTFYFVDIDFTSDLLIQNVAANERNPANVDDLFDDFNVVVYLCDDGNPIEADLNEPYNPPSFPSNINDEFFVGENFRICIKPSAEFSANFEIGGFNDVTCRGTPPSGPATQTRQVITPGALPGTGAVPTPEIPLTTIWPYDASPAPGDRPGPLHGIAFESVVTSGFGEDGDFECFGTVELALKTSRRMLQDGRELQEGFDSGNLKGSFKVTMTVVKPGLSTGAIVGISVAVAVVFFLVVFILYRRGCFAKRDTNKPPKTVVTNDENSDTTGDDQEQA